MYGTKLVIITLGRDIITIYNLENEKELLETAEMFGMDYTFSEGWMFCSEPHGTVKLEMHIIGAFNEEDIIFIVSEATEEVAKQIQSGKAKFHKTTDDEKSAKNRKKNYRSN